MEADRRRLDRSLNSHQGYTATSDPLPILTPKSPLVNMMGVVDTTAKVSDEADIVEKTAPLADATKETASQTTSFPNAFHDIGQSNSATFASLSQLRKNLIYTIISLALAVDLLNTWGFFTAIDKIACDVVLEQGGNAVWIVSAYAVALAACIPLRGRLRPTMCCRCSGVSRVGLRAWRVRTTGIVLMSISENVAMDMI